MGRLLHPLERFGWVSGTILVFVELLSWVVGTIDFQYRLGIGIAALIILGVTAVWSRVHKVETEPTTPAVLKVAVLAPHQYPKEVLPADQREKVLEVHVQRLLVKAMNGAIRKLRAKVSFGGRTPTYFRWGIPQVRIDGKEPEPSFDQIIFADLDETINLVREEERELPIYLFLKSKEGNFLKLNTEGHRIMKLNEIEPVPIDVDIQFLAENYTDDKARRFILHVESLDKLGLTERG
jgi:hypothetical protein